MALKQIEGATAETKQPLTQARETLARVRAWLRRVMPRVAVAALVLLVVRLLLSRTFLFGDNLLGYVLELASSLLICITVVYYGYKGLRWVKRRLLWRVRRRLIITYMFIGLTPVILLSILGFLLTMAIFLDGKERAITTQINEKEKLALANARNLALNLSSQPSNINDKELKSWLDQQNRLLQASLPGARLAVWRGNPGEDLSRVGHDTAAQWTSVFESEETRGVGSDQTPFDAALPQWLSEKTEWGGLAYVYTPAETSERFATPSIRAFVRQSSNTGNWVLLVSVPVSRALVEKLRESAGVALYPFFIGATNITIEEGGRIRTNNRAKGKGTPKGNGDKSDDASDQQEEFTIDRSKDQFGETIPRGALSIVIQPATNWLSGENSPRPSFLFRWSLSDAFDQLIGTSTFGRIWRWLLFVVSIVFLILELLALFAAAWMTRAVTGTVHKLYRATEFIKRGDFSHRVRVRSHDQLGELAIAFNEMSANIESLLQERVKHERLEREVEIAAEVQARLFPSRVPDLLKLGVAAECRAARGVAGDYYDYVEVAPGLVAFALGDVSGKGMSASLVMSNLQATLRAQAAIVGERLSMARRAVAASVAGSGDKLLATVVADADITGAVSRKVTNINAQLCQSTDANRFATLFLTLYEDRSRVLRYTNAGHNAPFLVRADGTVERLTTGGMMVGAFEWATYEEGSAQLEPGDTLVIYSDGITEAENASGEEYGEERLEELVVKHRDLSPDELRAAIFNEIDNWSNQKERGDDQTLVVMKSKI